MAIRAENVSIGGNLTNPLSSFGDSLITDVGNLSKNMLLRKQQAIENARQEELMGFKRNAEQRIIDEEKAKAAFRKRLADPGQTAFDSSAVNTVDKTVQKAVAGKDFIPDNADKYNAALVAARANGTEVDNKLFGMDDAGLDANKMNALYGDARVAPRLDPAKYEGYIIGQGRDLGIDPKEIAAELAIQKTQRPAKADTTLQDYANKLLIKDSIEGGSGGTKSKNSNSSKKYDNTTWESVRSKVDGKDLTPYGFNFMPGSDTSNFYKFLDVAESKGYSPKQSLFAGEMAITEDALGKGFDYDKALVNLANEEKPGSNTTAANLGGLLGGGTAVKYNGAAQGNLALAEQYPELLGRSGQVADTTGKGDKPIIGKSTVTGSMYDGKTVERDPSLTLTQQWNNPGAVKAASQTDKNAKWQGQVGVDSQGHAIFDTAENGYRAQAKNLITQVGKNPTVTDLIKGNKDKGVGAYATGNQDAYIKKISKDLGIDADTVLTAENVKALMKSMGEMEAGKGGDLKALEAGYNMAIGKEGGVLKDIVKDIEEKKLAPTPEVVDKIIAAADAENNTIISNRGKQLKESMKSSGLGPMSERSKDQWRILGDVLNTPFEVLRDIGKKYAPGGDRL